MFDNTSTPAHWWPDGLTQEHFASRAFADPAQQPLGDDDNMCGHYNDFEEDAVFLGNGRDGSGGFDVHSDQAFCDLLDAYIWPGNESLDGLLREEEAYTSNKVGSHLDDVMRDGPMATIANLLTAQPPEHLQDIALLSVAMHSNVPQLQPSSVDSGSDSGEPSMSAPAPGELPAGLTTPKGEFPEVSENTSSQESSEFSKLAGVRNPVIRKVRNSRSSWSALSAEGIDRRQAGVAAQQREQAHSLEQQRQQVKHQRAELQAQQAELQAQQQQLQRDYLAMKAGSITAAPPSAYPGGPMCPPFAMGVKLDPTVGIGPHCYLSKSMQMGTSLRSGSAFEGPSASGASGPSRASQNSGQYTYAASQQESGQLSGDCTPSGMCAAAPTQRLQQQRNTMPTMAHRPPQGSQQPVVGYGAGCTPDRRSSMDWQPQPQPQFYSVDPGGQPLYPGAGVAGGRRQAAPTEASMLGELKNLIGLLDARTKSTMQESLYRISRHAEGGMCPKVQQSAVAQCAAPVQGPNISDDIGPLDRAVADLLYTDPMQRMQPFSPGFGAAAGEPHQVGQLPTASEGSHGLCLVAVNG